METIKTSEQEIDNFSDALDEISELSSITVYEKLNATNDKVAKEEFLNNPDLVHPNNEYGNLNPNEINDGITTLNSLMDSISDSVDISSKEYRLATLVCDDGIKKYNFLANNYAYNAAKTPAEKAAIAKSHKYSNEVLYGKADEDTFVKILQEEIHKINPDSLSPEDHKLYENMLRQIGPLKPVEGELYRPKAETVERFSEIIKNFFEPFLKHVPNKGEELFTPHELGDIFNDIFKNEFGSLDVKYQAMVTDEVSNIGVNHEERILKIPAKPKSDYTTKRVKELIVHELGTHIYRAIPFVNGDSQDIFSQGLPNNETFDEGIAKCCEQAINGRYADSGREHYINIGLATFQGKNFREVYDIQFALKKLTGKKNTTTINSVQRCFRGTGELPNNKDLAYYNGSNMVWRLIEHNIDNPELLDILFLSGKVNMMDDRQRQLLYEKKMGKL